VCQDQCQRSDGIKSAFKIAKDYGVTIPGAMIVAMNSILLAEGNQAGSLLVSDSIAPRISPGRVI